MGDGGADGIRICFVRTRARHHSPPKTNITRTVVIRSQGMGGEGVKATRNARKTYLIKVKGIYFLAARSVVIGRGTVHRGNDGRTGAGTGGGRR